MGGEKLKQKKSLVTVSVVVILLITLMVVTYTEFFKVASDVIVGGEYETYSYHYVMIADNTDKELWNSVYNSAVADAKKKDAYIEMMGVNPSNKYSMLDYLNISEAANVDGIIICPDGSEQVKEKMTEITKKGIPIITIMQDEPESGRTAYVGINSYEIGELYESVIKPYVTDEVNNIMILQDNSEEGSIVIDQIKNVLNMKYYGKLKIEVTKLEKSDPFEAEETIRDIFLNKEETPDVLICLNGVNSECASQAAVDYNMVGDIGIVGYYTSEEVLSSIKKGIITATISLDTKELGEASVEALCDYYTTGYTSDYVCIDLAVVNMSNIGQYVNRTGDKDEN